MNATFLVTGATGFLGGFLTAELLRQGNRVIALARPRQQHSPGQRMNHLMKFFDLNPGNRLETVAAHIDRPGLGLDRAWLDRCRDRVDHVLHCAADTSFSPRRSRQVEQVNLQGLDHVFDAFQGRGHFHYMSTAYAAGTQTGAIAEALNRPEGFYNAYERSKNMAEHAIHHRCAETGTPLTLYRPAIVFGSAATGQAIRFNALYYPVRILLFLKNKLEKDLRENQGRRAAPLNIRLEEDGAVHMPISMPDTGGCIDLIPVDHLVRSVLAIVQSGSTGIFHIVNPKKNNLAQLLAFIRDTFGITGITTVKNSRNRPPTALESMMAGYMEIYAPYLCDQRHFEDTRARAILAPLGIACPELDLALFKKCMTFAVDTEFGARLTI